MTILADLTTLCAGDLIVEHVRVSTTDALTNVIATADAARGPLLAVDGGSNLLTSDAPFKGTVVDVQPFDEVASIIHEDPIGSAVVCVDAGTIWDAFASWALSEGPCGLGAFSGIPRAVGASPVQNVGAYGHEVSKTIESIEAYDRLTGIVVRPPPSDFSFTCHSSAIKCSVDESGLDDYPWRPTDRWAVLSVDSRPVRPSLSAPVMYAELVRCLGVEVGERADASLVRPTALDLRRGKGMVLNAENHDTWNAGSLSTNPVLPEAMTASLPGDVLRFSTGESLFKTSAAWLTDHADCDRGFHLPEAGDPPYAFLPIKHVLALMNHSGMTDVDVRALARAVCERVFDAFSVILVPEPATVDIAW